MITSYNTNNREEYIELFNELTILMLGYIPTKVLDLTKKELKYFYKVDKTGYVFKEIGEITSLADFNEALSQYDTLYIKAHRTSDNAEFDPIDIGFVESLDDDYLREFQGITSIEEYLSWLATLKDLNKEYVLKFMRVPVDEALNKIDTNTRVIELTADFKKNGIAVQGDNNAEVIYFRVNRFYDVVDLDTCEINIKWETPKNKQKGRYVSKYHDITTEPGYIYFEWPITKEVAGEAGTLKFSVQFIQKDSDGKVAYSLNTLTNSVSIKAGIGFDVGDESVNVDDGGTSLFDRIQFSEIVGGASAATPTFLKEPEDGEYDLSDKDGKNEYVLQALATSTDTGALTYTWKRIDLTDENEIKKDVSGETLASSWFYDPIEMENMVYGRVYYYCLKGKDPNSIENPAIVQRFIKKDEIDPELANKNEFYQKVSACVVKKDQDNDITGAYYVSVNNRITNSTAFAESEKRAIFPKPIKPKLDTLDATNGGFMDENNSEVELTISTKGKKDEEEASYLWKFKASKEADFEEITDAKAATYIVKPIAEGGKGSGYYTVDVSYTRNYETVTTSGADQGEIGENLFIKRVTKAPVVVNWKSKAPEAIQADDITETSVFTAQLTDIDGVEYDAISVGWYVYEPNVNGEDVNELITPFTLIANPEENKEFSLTFSADIQKAIKKITNGDLIAYYYPVIVNSINGQEAKSAVPSINSMFYIKPADIVAEPEVEALALDDDEPVEENNSVTLPENKLFFED